MERIIHLIPGKFQRIWMALIDILHCSFGRNTLNTTFHIGLQDIAKEDVDRVIKMIDETFEEVAK